MIKKKDYIILYIFCMDYHGGQWSRLYRLMSRLGRKLDTCVSVQRCKMERRTKLYEELVDKFGAE